MFEVLRKYNFGPDFIQWIRVFYNRVESCTINNGLTSVSPYLFVLCAEMLATKISNKKEIKGLQVGNEELKVIQFADDTNGIIADLKSAKHFLSTIEIFGQFNGFS
jgi:hypothetical protein